MTIQRTPISRRRFLGRATALAGGISMGLAGLQLSVAQAAGRTTLAAAPVLQPTSSVTASMAERVLVLDPANHYSISATTVLRHIFDPLVDVTSDSKFLPVLAE
jgi:ABC-type transport system substrate-binding protein